MRKKFIKWMLLTIILGGFIVLGVGIFLFPILDSMGRSHEKYRVEENDENWTWMGTQLNWIDPETAKVRPEEPSSFFEIPLRWITGFNYTDRLIYGKTSTWWFVLTSDEKSKLLDKLLLFPTEKKYEEYLAAQAVQVKKLINVPVFKAPDLSNGYRFVGWGDQLDLYRGSTCYTYSISSFGVFGSFVIGKGIRGERNYSDITDYWFAVDMSKEKTVFSADLNEITSITGLNTEQIKAGLQEIPRWHWVDKPLPFKRYEWSPCSRTSHSIQILYSPPSGNDISFVHFIVYYKRQNGYIFGRAWHEYFIFNTADEKTQFFELTKETDWLTGLNKLKLEPKDFTGYENKDKTITGFEQPPWADPGAYDPQATYMR